MSGKTNEEVHMLNKLKEQTKDESSDNLVQQLEEQLLSCVLRVYPDTKLVRQKWFHCSCQGVKNEKRGGQGAYVRNELRAVCPAEIRFECSKDGCCKVVKFVKDHNHTMALSHKRHFLKSGRHVSESNGSVLESFGNAGIKLSDGISYLINESVGPQNVSFTSKDAYNYHYSKQGKIF
ncbi:hypothetical protein BUALT_Bualt15G0107800 [Buddleja alternifolia]|uniref:FAR1 domain-containing protein n=1 Tax=Buddleja alternifolia TaxID=168488 RepID=A0AAV6WPX3_9LAMI|nr:hypothetical protein BUALT_Bualt15G0107800 [Buddleja alternifolia]